VSDDATPPGFQPLSTGGAFLARAGQLFIRGSGDDACVIGTRIGPAQTNSEGFAHGGFLVTFVDVALSVVTRGDMLSLSSDFLRPGRSGSWIVAQVKIQKSARSLVFADASVMAGDIVLMRAQGLYRPRQAPDQDAPSRAADPSS